MNLFDFEATTIDDTKIKLDQFRGRVLLIVNVASKCGFTPQYAGLESLYQKHRASGLEILAFPCNQFLWQEPGGAESIQACSLKYQVSFPVFAKVKVNGPNAHPLFKYLKQSCPGFLGTRAIKWNFTKFLVNRDGLPVRRFGTTTPPAAIEPALTPLLSTR